MTRITHIVVNPLFSVLFSPNVTGNFHEGKGNDGVEIFINNVYNVNFIFIIAKDHKHAMK